jgi:hypothetical protein
VFAEHTYKRCSVDGRWEGKDEGDFSTPQGWTNYTPCFTPEILELIRKLYSNDDAKVRVLNYSIQHSVPVRVRLQKIEKQTKVMLFAR